MQTLTSRDQCTSVPDAVYTCGGTDGWRRAAYLNMTEHPNTECPSGWQLFTENSKGACDKSSNGRFNCDSVFFPVAGGPYSQMCGRIRAYQKGLTSAFIGSSTYGQTTIDSAYVSGVAVMHGSPRQHIWTFAAGGRDNFSASLNNCPCDPPFINRPVPSFVGEYYFCESGYDTQVVVILGSLYFAQMTLSGMAKTVTPPVHAALFTILHGADGHVHH